ncbi:SnoaL-like domain-containing protein [Sphingobium faniae]|nr:SnoaL-like domain-containing protein [Sphingobium faniae]
MIEEQDREWLDAAQPQRRGFLALVAGVVGMGALSSGGARAATAASAGQPQRGISVSGTQHELVARMAILDGLARYCRAMDRSDRALQDTIWHADATAQYLDHPIGSYSMPLDSGQTLVDSKAHTHHRIVNVYMEVNGDRAVSEGYGDSVIRDHPLEDGTVVENIYRGRYIDRWTLKDGRWAIQHRRYIGEIFGQIRYDNTQWPAFAKRPGKHDRGDESYQYFS